MSHDALQIWSAQTRIINLEGRGSADVAATALALAPVRCDFVLIEPSEMAREPPRRKGLDEVLSQAIERLEQGLIRYGNVVELRHQRVTSVVGDGVQRLREA